MGRSVLHAVADRLDGRVSCPVLYRIFCEACSLRTLPQLNRFLLDNVNNKTEIARFAPLADRATLEGDVPAGEIVRDSARQLFGMVRDALKKMGSLSGVEAVSVWLWGSVLTHSKPVCRDVKKLLEEKIHARVAFPPCGALDAALAVARHGAHP